MQYTINSIHLVQAFRWLGQNAQYLYYTPFRIGLCSPSQCSPHDVQSMISKLAMKFNMTAEVLGMKCSISETANAVNRSQLLCLWVLTLSCRDWWTQNLQVHWFLNHSLAFGLIFLLVFTGTFVDVYRIGETSKKLGPAHLHSVTQSLNDFSHLKHESVIGEKNHSNLHLWSAKDDGPFTRKIVSYMFDCPTDENIRCPAKSSSILEQTRQRYNSKQRWRGYSIRCWLQSLG